MMTSGLGRCLRVALLGAPLLVGAGALHAEGEGMMGHGVMGMGMMGEGDAKVSKAQFMQHAEQRFARMDANGDGVLDASDRAAMRQRMRECMAMMDGGGMGPTGGDMQGGAGAAGQDHEAHHPKQ